MQIGIYLSSMPATFAVCKPAFSQAIAMNLVQVQGRSGETNSTAKMRKQFAPTVDTMYRALETE